MNKRNTLILIIYINTITIGLQTSGFAKHIKGSHIVAKMTPNEKGANFFFKSLFFLEHIQI